MGVTKVSDADFEAQVLNSAEPVVVEDVGVARSLRLA